MPYGPPPNPPPHLPSPGEDPWRTTNRMSAVPSGPPGRPPVYGQPSMDGQVPGKKSNQPLIIGIIGGAVALVLMCCGGLYIIGAEEQKKQKASSPDTAVTTGAALTPSVQATTATPAPSSAAATTAAAPRSTAPAGPKTVAMPKVTGENAAVADDTLRKLGFTNIQYGSQDKDDTFVLLLANWTVTKQSAKAGAKVKTDTLIVLTCTKQG
jgi:hypothetical protein